MSQATTSLRAPLVPAVLPLAVLEAMRGLDAPVPDALDEFHGELSSKRLGLNRTVLAQIERLARLGPRGRVPVDELAALLRLVARRQDAGLVFSEAGRRAARHALRRVARSTRAALAVLPRGLRARSGFVVVARLAEPVLGLRLVREHGAPSATPVEGAGAPPEHGSPCAFYGSALAELLRALTEFDGAMIHASCRARGDATCVWRAALPPS